MHLCSLAHRTVDKPRKVSECGAPMIMASPIASKAQYMYINANMYDNWKQQTCFID